MENKNTFPFKRNIKIYHNRPELIPQTGDELVFCKDEDIAMTSYVRYRDEERDASYEPIEEEFLTDLFKKESVNGAMANPVYIANKKFGFFGCRTKPSGRIVEGKFFLYEME